VDIIKLNKEHSICFTFLLTFGLLSCFFHQLTCDTLHVVLTSISDQSGHLDSFAVSAKIRV